MDYLNSSRKTLLSDYENNPLLRLVFFCGAGYVMLHLAKIVIFMWQQVPTPSSTQYFYDKIYVHFALQTLDGMLQHPWAIFSFMFTGISFLKLFTTLLWLFLFGNVLQQLIGKSEVFPLFLLSNIIGGIAFVLMQSYYPLAIPQSMFSGADAAVLAFALGSLVIAPNYKVYFSNDFKVPLWALVLIYIVLVLAVNVNTASVSYFALLGTGSLVGIIYTNLAKRGVKLGVWGNKFVKGAEHKFESKRKVGDQVFQNTNTDLNAILDKINKNGIQSLSKEEKVILEQYK